MRLRNILPFLALAWLVASNWGWFRVQEDVITPDLMDAGARSRTTDIVSDYRLDSDARVLGEVR